MVREERQLTYDASFQLQNREIIAGSWYLVSVTSSPAQVQAAVRACKEALASLKGPFGILGDSIQSARRTLWNKFCNEETTNQFWVENLCGTQLSCFPHKTLGSISEFETMLGAVTVQDIEWLVEQFNFSEENMTACVGITSPAPPPPNA